MIRSAKIIANIASNWVGFAVNAAVTLIITPLILHQVGEARYGIWVLTSSVIGYYGLLDFGFRGGITQYLTRYIALQDYGKAKECISSAVAALFALGLILVVLSFTAAPLALHVFDIPIGMEQEAFWCILIVGFTGALQCVFFPFGAIFTATQRFDISNLIGVGSRLLMAAGIYTALRMGEGLIGISVATCVASLVDYLVRWRVAYRIAPELVVSWRKVKLARLREMGSFGVWNFMMAVSAYAYLHMQALLIGALMPIAAVAHFALASGLVGQIRDVLSPVGHVLYPVAAELYARGDRSALERLYRDGTRLMMIAVSSVVLLAAFWAEDFYRLWIGEKFLIDSPFSSVALLLQILLVSVAASYASNLGSQILLGAGRVRQLATSVICETGFNLIMSVILIRPYGLIGVAASSVFASVIVRLIVIPLLLQKGLGLPLKDFLNSICIRPLAVNALLVILILGIRLTGRPGDWFHLIFHGVLFGVGTLVVVLVVGVTAEERERFLWQPLRRMLRKGSFAALDAKQ